jgi:hypothetical protein
MGKNEAPAEHGSGAGQVHQRTITIAETLIVIDSIASIQILEVRPGWLLAALGLVTAGGGVGVMTLLNTTYDSLGSSGSPTQVVGIILVGVGLAMIVGNWLLPVRRSLGIGTSDGRTSYVVSKDRAFLHRLFEVLASKINTRNESLTASFDITHGTFKIHADSQIVTINDVASNAGGRTADIDRTSAIADGTLLAPHLVAVAAPAWESEPAAVIDPDEALFTDDPSPARPPLSVEPGAERPMPPRVAVPPLTGSRDSLRDGPETAAREADDREWLSIPGRISYASAPEGGGARWLLPLVLLLLAGGGGFAGWYFYRQSKIQPLESSLALPLGAFAQTAQ